MCALFSNEEKSASEKVVASLFMTQAVPFFDVFSSISASVEV